MELERMIPEEITISKEPLFPEFLYLSHKTVRDIKLESGGMILNQPDTQDCKEGLNEKTALPSKHLISSLGSVTNGFLFSTTPIILKILQKICNNMDESANSFILSGWLYGSIIGILLFGYIGDTLGYYKGMVIASSLSFTGIVLSALSLFLSPSGIPFIFGFSRIILGIGCGGSIPIAYTRTDTSNKKSISQTSSLLLLLQSSSWLIGPIIFSLALTRFGRTNESLKSILCLVLCFASIPSLLSIIILLRSYNSVIYVPLAVDERDTQVVDIPPVSSIPEQYSLFRVFLGTGVTWFLYDFNSYGNTFFSRLILQPVLPMEDTPVASTIPIILAGVFGVPGQFLVHWVLKQWDPRKTQVIGFLVLALLFLFASVGFSYLSSYHNYLLIFIYQLTFFFSTCGPGSTTYILPSLMYSKDVLSLYHGICSCMGKLGGAIGSTAFPMLVEKLGVSKTLFFSGIVSLIASFLTVLLPSSLNIC